MQKEVDHILQASRMQRLEGHASAHDAGNTLLRYDDNINMQGPIVKRTVIVELRNILLAQRHTAIQMNKHTLYRCSSKIVL